VSQPSTSVWVRFDPCKFGEAEDGRACSVSVFVGRSPRFSSSVPRGARTSLQGSCLSGFGVDRCNMLWPVAVLAVSLLGFAVVYGSVVQSRLEACEARKNSGHARQD